jgi:hypothetical protein
MKTIQSRPSRLRVDIWVQGRGYDVTSMNKGETALTYHIRIRSIRAPSKTVDLKSVALGNAGANALVVFAHATPLEWTCSVKSSKANPGLADYPVDVDQNTAGQSILQALELTLTDPLGPPTTEAINLGLDLTIS